jgi:hypothetical protein
MNVFYNINTYLMGSVLIMYYKSLGASFMFIVVLSTICGGRDGGS